MSNPINAIEEYFRLNIEKKLLLCLPEDDDYQLTTGTRLLEIRRQMQEVDQGLSTQKEEYSSKMDSIEQRNADLNRKKKQLKESLEKFDKFLKENDSKKSRAIKKTAEERKIREAKESEILKLKDGLEHLNSQKDRQNKIIKRDFRYQQFLEYVLETFQDFDEIKDLVSRYETLMATYHDLMERSAASSDSIEHERKKLSTLLENRNHIILGYNNELARLQSRYEEIQQYSGHLDTLFDQKINENTEKSLLVGRIIMTTNNLYNLVKNHFNSRLVSTTDTVTQLKKIQQAIIDLSEITKELGDRGEFIKKRLNQ